MPSANARFPDVKAVPPCESATLKKPYRPRPPSDHAGEFLPPVKAAYGAPLLSNVSHTSTLPPEAVTW